MSWYPQLVHRYTLDDCHDHPAGDATGSLSGSVEGPSHSYPSSLRVTAFATDARGEATVVSRQLEPAVARLHLSSNVWGTVAAIDSETHALPYDIDMIKGSDVTVSAVSPSSSTASPTSSGRGATEVRGRTPWWSTRAGPSSPG